MSQSLRAFLSVLNLSFNFSIMKSKVNSYIVNIAEAYAINID